MESEWDLPLTPGRGGIILLRGQRNPQSQELGCRQMRGIKTRRCDDNKARRKKKGCCRRQKSCIRGLNGLRRILDTSRFAHFQTLLHGTMVTRELLVPPDCAHEDSSILFRLFRPPKGVRKLFLAPLATENPISKLIFKIRSC